MVYATGKHSLLELLLNIYVSLVFSSCSRIGYQFFFSLNICYYYYFKQLDISYVSSLTIHFISAGQCEYDVEKVL